MESEKPPKYEQDIVLDAKINSEMSKMYLDNIIKVAVETETPKITAILDQKIAAAVRKGYEHIRYTLKKWFRKGDSRCHSDILNAVKIYYESKGYKITWTEVLDYESKAFWGTDIGNANFLIKW